MKGLATKEAQRKQKKPTYIDDGNTYSQIAANQRKPKHTNKKAVIEMESARTQGNNQAKELDYLYKKKNAQYSVMTKSSDKLNGVNEISLPKDFNKTFAQKLNASNSKREFRQMDLEEEMLEKQEEECYHNPVINKNSREICRNKQYSPIYNRTNELLQKKQSWIQKEQEIKQQKQNEENKDFAQEGKISLQKAYLKQRIAERIKWSERQEDKTCLRLKEKIDNSTSMQFKPKINRNTTSLINIHDFHERQNDYCMRKASSKRLITLKETPNFHPYLNVNSLKMANRGASVEKKEVYTLRASNDMFRSTPTINVHTLNKENSSPRPTENKCFLDRKNDNPEPRDKNPKMMRFEDKEYIKKNPEMIRFGDKEYVKHSGRKSSSRITAYKQPKNSNQESFRRLTSSKSKTDVSIVQLPQNDIPRVLKESRESSKYLNFVRVNNNSSTTILFTDEDQTANTRSNYSSNITAMPYKKKSKH